MLLDINGAIFDWINDGAGNSSFIDNVMKWAAAYATWAIVALAVIGCFVPVGSRQTGRMALYTAVPATLLALAVTLAIQHIYVHQRPFVLRSDVVLLTQHAADPSFPSEHTTAAFALAAGVGLYRARLGVVLLFLAFLTAYARIFVGIHYPADVAAGAAIGVFAALIVWLARPLFARIDDALVPRLIPAFLR